MGKLAEVNQSTKIVIQLFDGNTAKFPRFRIYNNAGVEQVAAPFNSPIDPAHVASGLYNTTFTPNVEGEYTITKKVYNEVGRTTLDKKYNEIVEDISIRSIDQDLATLLVRAPALLETVAQANTRQSALIAEHDASQVTLAAILADTDTSIPALIAALNNISIADVQTAMTNQNYTSARGLLLSNLDVLLSTRSTQASVNVIDGIVDAILVDTDTTIPALISALNDLSIANVQTALTNQGYTSGRAPNLDNADAAVSTRQSEASALSRATTNQTEHDATQTDISNIPTAPTVGQVADAVWDELKSGHNVAGSFGENLDGTITSRATQVSVNGIQNNTNFVAIFPAVIERPDSGSIDVKALVRLFDTEGNPEDPDGDGGANPLGLVNFRTELTDGTVVIANTAMTRTGIGLYELTASIPSTGVLGFRYIFFEYIENGIAFNQVRQGALVETADINQQIFDNTVAIKDQSDQLAFGTSGIEVSDESKTDVVDQVWDEAQTGHTTPGTMGKRLDADMSTRESESSASGRASTNQTEHDQTQSDIAGLSSSNPTLQEIEDAVWDADKGDHTDNNTFGEVLNDVGAVADPDAIADAVWDETRAEHTNAGSFGEVLDDKISTRESEADAIARAGLAAKEATVDAGFTAGAKDNTVAKEGTLSGKASQTSVDNVKNVADTIKSKTDGLNFIGNDVRSNAQVITDKAGFSLTEPEKVDIASKVWDQNTADHQGAGSTGKALDDAQSATDPNAIADAIWDEAAGDHVAPSTMGGKLNEARNLGEGNDTKNDTILSRLTAGRAAKIDNLDATITSRQSEADALSRFNDLTADIANAVTILNGIAGDVSGSDPDNLSILQILNSATFGLAQLRIQLDAKSTLAQMATVLGDLASILGNQNNGSTGFAALKVISEAINTLLVDGNFGLSRLRTEIDLTAKSNELGDIPSALEISEIIWDELTSNPRNAGSYGALVKANLDAKITTRATNTDLATVDTIVDDIKALLENGTFGLNALLDEVNANEVKIDANGVAIADVDSNLSTARADILAAIALIVDGTPAIIAVLDEIKGAGFVEATDALKAISAKIAAGTATIGNQTTILTKLNDMHGAGPAASDNIKDTKVIVAQNTGEIQANNTQIRDDVATVDGKVDSNATEIAAVKARLDDANFGLSKAKTDRDTNRADILAGQTTLGGKVDTVEAKVDTVDGKVVSSEAAILAAINALDVSLIDTNVQGIIALLQDGVNGLSAIKNAVTQVKIQEQANSDQIVSDISGVDTKVDSLSGLVTAIMGAGFTAGDSLVAIKAAILAIDTEADSLALESTAQAILTELENIKDGSAGGYDGSTDSLKAISAKGSELQGFEGGEG